MFEEVFVYFQKKIFSGEFKPNSQIKSRRSYEIKFNTSKKTIESVFQKLKDFNFIYSIPKKGYFICDIDNQMIFKSEALLMDADSIIVEKNNNLNSFNFTEVKRIFKDKSIHLDDFYTYNKEYYKDNDIKKLSISYNNKKILWNKNLISKSLYLVLSAQNIIPKQRIELIKGGVEYSRIIRNKLKVNNKEGVVIYFLLVNSDNNLLHITKQFLIQSDIEWKYNFRF